MMDNMIIGRYVPGSSLLHKMDPRTKLSLVFLFVCIVFIANNTVTYTILGAYTLLLVALSRVQPRFLFNGLKPILFLIVFTFLLHIFFGKRGQGKGRQGDFSAAGQKIKCGGCCRQKEQQYKAFMMACFIFFDSDFSAAHHFPSVSEKMYA